MLDLNTVSVKWRNHLCFGEESVGFDRIAPINLIIGRNNSGKSTLLNLIGDLAGKPPHEVTAPCSVSIPPGREDFQLLRDQGYHLDLGKITRELENGRMLFRMEAGDVRLVLEDEYLRQIWRPVVVNIGNPLQPFRFMRLLPDRDLVPEAPTTNIDRLGDKGGKVTQIYQAFLAQAKYAETLVEDALLAKLNQILFPDAQFDRISVQETNQLWEIYLTPTGGARIAVSQMGSGIRTVLIILAYLHLWVEYLGVNNNGAVAINQFIFGLEEIENNLHPALEKRLLLYLKDFAVENKCYFILPTHSPIAIDLFANDENAQIIHMVKRGDKYASETIKEVKEQYHVLDDLGVRASDLLQANGIVWLEGPSDRVYFNKWISLMDARLKEGVHYQCVFYGGRLLSRLSADSQGESADSGNVQILRVNRNAIVVADSDRKYLLGKINASKQRIEEELDSNNGLAWITKGREIENYIPNNALRKLYPAAQSVLEPYRDIKDYLNEIQPKAGDSFEGEKIKFAKRVCEHLTKEDLLGTLDLGERLKEVLAKIYQWNDLSEPESTEQPNPM